MARRLHGCHHLLDRLAADAQLASDVRLAVPHRQEPLDQSETLARKLARPPHMLKRFFPNSDELVEGSAILSSNWFHGASVTT
jgi:hypothetical protein